MSKREIMAKIKLREEKKEKKFMDFIQSEKFNKDIDKVGNFAKNMPVFYKQVSDNKFLVFNIPYYGKVKYASFQTDFWEVIALSESEFLNGKLLNENLNTVLLGFNLEEDIELYRSQEAESTLR